MDQVILLEPFPIKDEQDLTWVNVGIALAFILVDGILFVTELAYLHSRLLDWAWPGYCKVGPRRLNTMSCSIIPYGILQMIGGLIFRVSFWIVSSPLKIRTLFSD